MILPGTEDEGGGLLVAREDHLDDHSGAGLTAGGRGLAYGGIAQQLLELPDAGFLLALLVLGRVVATVLFQVAFFAGGLDASGDLCPTRAR